MTDLILHHYDASPFTQKALLMLGCKGATWRSVETPMMPPKDDLVALTGGYRGTPVLQHGADIYIDSQRIATVLDQLMPQHPLLPAACGGLALMLNRWSDTFFRCALYRAIDQTVAHWDPAFVADRRQLFPDVDFDRAAAEAPHRADQFRAHCALLEQQLADGRAFLGGPHPTLLDVQAWPFIWMSKGLAGTDELLAGFDRLAAWDTRVAAIGEGERLPIEADVALDEARALEPEPVAPTEGFGGLQAGAQVTVEPDDTRRGGVTGELLHVSPDTIIVRHRNDRVGAVHVHFPRIGYRISPD
ncbi:MAG: glutathione S-transferase family protein [Pseudomonadota bacterium]